MNPSKIANTFAGERQMIYSNKTISNHIDYLADAFLISKASRYDIKGGICMKRNYWALLVFVLIIVLQWIGLGFHGQIRFIFLIIILVLIVLLAILLRK